MSENHCADIVRRHDYERYVMVLFAPKTSRAALFALYAFHYEIAKIQNIVSEPMVGLIRMQWWRDTVKTAFTDKSAPHPVIQALHTAIHTGTPWQEHELNALIDAYEPFLENVPVEGFAPIISNIAKAFVVLQKKAWFLDTPSVESDQHDVNIVAAHLMSKHFKQIDLENRAQLRLWAGPMPSNLPMRLTRHLTDMNVKKIEKQGDNAGFLQSAEPDHWLALKLWFKVNFF